MATESSQHSSSCEEALDKEPAAKKKPDMMMTLHRILQRKHTNVAPTLVASHMTSSSLPSPYQAQAQDQARNPKPPNSTSLLHVDYQRMAWWVPRDGGNEIRKLVESDRPPDAEWASMEEVRVSSPRELVEEIGFGRQPS